MNWISVNDKDNIPPDAEVMVKDEFGNEGRAIPTYFPFTVDKLPGDEKKPWGWRGTLIPCDNHWDGGWMIIHQELSNPLNGNIQFWCI